VDLKASDAKQRNLPPAPPTRREALKSPKVLYFLAFLLAQIWNRFLKTQKPAVPLGLVNLVWKL